MALEVLTPSGTHRSSTLTHHPPPCLFLATTPLDLFPTGEVVAGAGTDSVERARGAGCTYDARAQFFCAGAD